MLLNRARIAVIAAIATLCAAPVMAGPFYLASTSIDNTHYEGSTPVAAIASGGNLSSGVVLFGSAFASHGALGATSASTWNFSTPGTLLCTGFFCGYSVSSQAQLSLDDLIISAPADSDLISVQTNLHLSVAGQVTASAFASGGFEYGSEGTAGILLDGLITNNDDFAFGFGGGMSIVQWNGNFVQGTSCFASSDVFGDYPGCNDPRFRPLISGIVATGAFDIPLGVPLTLNMTLSASAGAAGHINGGGTFASSGRADFYDTVTFATSGPVFDLPEGFDANSVDGAIVHNRFVGSEPAATPVPEPASLTLLASGLAAATARQRRRKKN
jgi:hypothetical protein